MIEISIVLLLAMAAAGLLNTIRIGNKIMANQTDLQNQITELETTAQANSTIVTQSITSLEAKVAAGAPDLQPELDRLRGVVGVLNATNAAAQAAIAQG